MHIALFGGAFDPPHLGHKQVADNLIAQKIVDEVWFVPVFTHPWAAKIGKEFLTPYEQRVDMLEIMLADATSLEARQPYQTAQSVQPTQPSIAAKQKVAEFRGVSFTYPTLEYFSQKYPEHTFSWVMGSEYLPKFDAFLEGHPGLIDYHFYIYPRSGVPFKPMYENMTALKEMPEIVVSSRMVRGKVECGEDVSSFLVKELREYISKNNLYCDDTQII